MIETGVLVWKWKNMKPYQPIFFYFGSNMLKTKWWIHVSYGFCSFECQIKPRVWAEKWAKSWNDRLYTLYFYIVEQSRLESHPLIRWRTHKLTNCQQPTYLNFMTRTSTSKPSIITLPKYTVSVQWRVVYAILIFCWSTSCFFTLLRFTQHFYIAKPYPIPTHCWGILYLITLLSNPQILIHCWAIPNPNTLLRYSLS